MTNPNVLTESRAVQWIHQCMEVVSIYVYFPLGKNEAQKKGEKTLRRGKYHPLVSQLTGALSRNYSYVR